MRCSAESEEMECLPLHGFLGCAAAFKASAHFSSGTPSFSARMDTLGALPVSVSICSDRRTAFMESSFNPRETFTVPPSRNRRRISPKMTGTAYVENL